MLRDERIKLISGLSVGDFVILRHGRGKIRAKVVCLAPFLMTQKISKGGHEMEPALTSSTDVLEKMEDQSSVTS